MMKAQDQKIEKLYKLTDHNGCTRDYTQWGPSVTHIAPGEGELCGPGWIHAYSDPLLAVLLDSIYANYQDPLLWECEGEIGITDGLIIGCTWLTTMHQIPLPKITPEQRVKFAVLCAMEVYKDPRFVTWAEAWLSPQDRRKAVAEATEIAELASNVAAKTSVLATAWAADSAESAALAAVREAWMAADMANVDKADIYKLSWETARAAEAAVFATAPAALDLVAIAHKACEE